MEHSGGDFRWEGLWGNTPTTRWIIGRDLAIPLESRVCASWDPRAKDTGTLGNPTAQTLALSVPLNIYVITSRAYSVPCPEVVPSLSHSQVHSFVPLQERQPELLFGRLSLNTAPETLSQNYVSSYRMLEPCFHTEQTEN